MEVGISVRIDVTKIDKARLFKGEKGTYLDLTTFVDLDQQNQYGNNGFISQSVSREERQAGLQGVILGNVKVFHKGDQQRPEQNYQQPAQQQTQQLDQQRQAFDGFDDDIPF